ncbi:MAG TPA: tyrosine-type recombinase/integrase [Ginsengibacter sp.]|nr:tyrosine-type recombinase/integrase [Ginsengibacter sp.]
MPQSDYITQFCDYLASEKRFSIHTVSNYHRDLTDFRDFMATTYNLPPENARPPLIRSWLASLKERDMEATSINRKISALKSFYKFLLKRQLILKNPSAGIISLKQKKRLPSFVEETQIMPVLDRSHFPDGIEGSTRFLAITLLYITGVRVSELTGIKEQDIDYASAIIRIIGKGNKQRNVPLTPQTILQIRNYIAEKRKEFENQTAFLLVNKKGNALTRGMVYNIVKQELSTVTTLKKKSPHVLRHSFATHLSNHGAGINEIKELLGHASLASTQVYTHTAIARLKEIYQKAHPKG